VGQSYYDRNPLDTISATTALEACAAFTGDSGLCSTYTCGTSDGVVCSDGAANCDCWQYTGTLSGYVDPSSTTDCFCPINTDPTWN